MIASYQGRVGSANRVTGLAGTVADDARLASYLIHASGWSPAWHHYLLSVISLRDLEGFPPARRDYPEAEYELSVFAVDSGINDPGQPPPDPADLGTLRLLTPQNLSVQFHEVDETMAAHIGEMAMKAVCDGYLIPEPEGIIGARDAWKLSVAQTIEHHKAGRHQHGDH